MGAVETQMEAAEKPVPVELNPDKGFGRPGSLKWHILQIRGLTTNGALYKYCREVTGKGFGIRNLNVEQCREIAIGRIREHLKDDES